MEKPAAVFLLFGIFFQFTMYFAVANAESLEAACSTVVGFGGLSVILLCVAIVVELDEARRKSEEEKEEKAWRIHHKKVENELRHSILALEQLKQMEGETWTGQEEAILVNARTQLYLLNELWETNGCTVD